MILVLSGTNRPNSNTKKVTDFVFSSLQSQPGINNASARFLDLQNLRPDIFDSGSYAKKPQWFLDEFQDPILKAKGMIVVTPEYNGGFPGVLKYFIDMLKFPESLVGLPVAFIGVAAGQFAALRPVEQLELIFHYRKAHIFGERVFIPKIDAVLGESPTLGEYSERIQKLVTGFATFANCAANSALNS